MRLYAILRADLQMPLGKAAAQAGHAYLEAYFAATTTAPELASAYRADPPGTKVVLIARSLPARQILCPTKNCPQFSRKLQSAGAAGSRLLRTISARFSGENGFCKKKPGD